MHDLRISKHFLLATLRILHSAILFQSRSCIHFHYDDRTYQSNMVTMLNTSLIITSLVLLCNHPLSKVESFAPHNDVARLSSQSGGKRLIDVGKLSVVTSDYFSSIVGEEDKEDVGFKAKKRKTSSFRPGRRRTPPMAGRWFQLNIYERWHDYDDDAPTNLAFEIFLNPDGTVTSTRRSFGNGPKFVRLEGIWEQRSGTSEGQQRYVMNLTFTFQQFSEGLGKISYTVNRTYRSDCASIGPMLATNGNIVDQDKFNNGNGGAKVVGHFSMLDMTDYMAKSCLDVY